MVVDPLSAAMSIAGSGIEAQSLRMRVISENLANMNSTASRPGAEPYRRKTISFQSHVDETSGAEQVRVDRISHDRRPFRLEFEPAHPSADAAGYVKYPNVELIVESADMREAVRSFEASLQVVRQAREMSNMMIELLRNA
jgi:flagellar basal-body rod protein FlgC